MNYVIKVKVAERDDGSTRWVVLGNTTETQAIIDFLICYRNLKNPKSEIQITSNIKENVND